MKKVKVALALILCILSFTACIYENEYDMSDEFDYYDGYDNGYEDGYEDGKAELVYAFEEICTDEINNAVTILLDYVEHGHDGEYSEEEKRDAADILFFYFYDVCKLIGYEP